jgi:hypothetical protein
MLRDAGPNKQTKCQTKQTKHSFRQNSRSGDRLAVADELGILSFCGSTHLLLYELPSVSAF